MTGAWSQKGKGTKDKTEEKGGARACRPGTLCKDFRLCPQASGGPFVNVTLRGVMGFARARWPCVENALEEGVDV